MVHVARPGRDSDTIPRERVVEAQAGSVDAFEELIRQHERSLYIFIHGFVRDPDDARDLTQEVWLRVSRHIGELREPDGFVSWLYRIARNCCLDFIRAKKSRITPVEVAMRAEFGEPPDLPDLDDVGPEQHILSFDEQRKVWEALGALSEADRVALFLREYQELSYSEIGSVLGVSRNAAEVRVFRARQRFRRQFARIDVIIGGCNVSSLELSALVEDEGSTVELVMLRRHVPACARCTERLEAMRAGRELYRNLAMHTLPETLLIAELAAGYLQSSAPTRLRSGGGIRGAGGGIKSLLGTGRRHRSEGGHRYLRHHCRRCSRFI